MGELKDFKNYYAKALGNGLKKSAKKWELASRLKKQSDIKELIDTWMLMRQKSILADQLPQKFDNIVFCRLAAEQEEVYMRVLDSKDYKQLEKAEELCGCGSGEITKK